MNKDLVIIVGVGINQRCLQVFSLLEGVIVVGYPCEESPVPSLDTLVLESCHSYVEDLVLLELPEKPAFIFDEEKIFCSKEFPCEELHKKWFIESMSGVPP